MKNTLLSLSGFQGVKKAPCNQAWSFGIDIQSPLPPVYDGKRPGFKTDSSGLFLRNLYLSGVLPRIKLFICHEFRLCPKSTTVFLSTAMSAGRPITTPSISNKKIHKSSVSSAILLNSIPLPLKSCAILNASFRVIIFNLLCNTLLQYRWLSI